MLKFRKKKLTQRVSRVEDLQVGDLIQLDLINRAKIRNIYETRNDHFEIKLEIENADPENPNRHSAVALHRDLKVFIWQ